MTGAERVRVVLERSGGFAGRTIRRGLDTDDLPAAAADRLRALVAGLPEAPARAMATAPDRFAYTVEVDGGDRRGRHHFAEPVPAEAKDLIQLLSRAPLLPAPR
ncbi:MULTISPECIES: protealysin inhibitor emfourin [Pseudofrankia]|uniref:protealysin inhibitor emfourin n=1 Tax=Pseudofrankia TaxID=2994363 RepID=UPI000234C535|nr:MULTISPECIES: protealysin inhibitor emfourin [Pseudofrankia]OHV36444.1 hypothetical protein BCD49_19560 [Pseudofrankia sp. EUN1h]